MDKVLKLLPKRLAERELTAAVRAGANVIRKEARARAPRGGVSSEMSQKFGPLHKKIRARRVKKTRRHNKKLGGHHRQPQFGYFP